MGADLGGAGARLLGVQRPGAGLVPGLRADIVIVEEKSRRIAGGHHRERHRLLTWQGPLAARFLGVAA